MNTRTRQKIRATLNRKAPPCFAIIRDGDICRVKFVPVWQKEIYLAKYGDRIKFYDEEEAPCGN